LEYHNSTTDHQPFKKVRRFISEFLRKIARKEIANKYKGDAPRDTSNNWVYLILVHEYEPPKVSETTNKNEDHGKVLVIYPSENLRS
jgi:hypothetical protein